MLNIFVSQLKGLDQYLIRNLLFALYFHFLTVSKVRSSLNASPSTQLLTLLITLSLIFDGDVSFWRIATLIASDNRFFPKVVGYPVRTASITPSVNIIT